MPGVGPHAAVAVAALTDAIDTWVSHWNHDPKPFVWTATASNILNKVQRARAVMNHLTKSATDH